MRAKKSVLGRVVYYCVVVLLLIAVVQAYGLYKENNFNEFLRSELKMGYSEFKRDDEITYSDMASYRITNSDFNDALFSKTVKVTPNTPYKVTCMVKTQDVVTEHEPSLGGAQIVISNTVEKSKPVSGTTDWTKVEFYFNSKNREEVDIGFRLGGYDDNVKGTAWFSDFTLEAGSSLTSTDWDFACFFFNQIDAVANSKGEQKRIQTIMQDADYYTMQEDMERFTRTCTELSGGLMTAEFDMFRIAEPITSLSYDESNGYYVGAKDVFKQIEPYLQQKEYDHIFVCIDLGNANDDQATNTTKWIGLGGMDYLQIGFSNVHIPRDNKEYLYHFAYNRNEFPEEVFIHEFLHTLERNAQENGYTIPELHDNAKYDYEENSVTGLRNWYAAYMTQTIQGGQGLPKEVYQTKPVHASDLEYTYTLRDLDEPANAVQELVGSIKRLFQITNT